MNRTKTQKLMICAMMIAISTVLAFLSDLVPFLHLPFGGSFTLASMLPIIIAAYLFGTGWGLGCAFTYSVLQLLISFRTVSALFLPESDDYMGSATAALLICFIDYILAYTLLGFGGVFRKCLRPTAALVLGCVFAVLLRYAAHVLSGYIFYGEWAEWFFSQEDFYSFGKTVLDRFDGKALALIYSAVYNGLYMIPELIITAIAAIPVSKLSILKKL